MSVYSINLRVLCELMENSLWLKRFLSTFP